MPSLAYNSTTSAQSLKPVLTSLICFQIDVFFNQSYFFQIDVISRESHDSYSDNSSNKESILRLRLAPHRMDNTPEILAECSLDHPFFIKEKGKPQPHKFLLRLDCFIQYNYYYIVIIEDDTVHPFALIWLEFELWLQLMQFKIPNIVYSSPYVRGPQLDSNSTPKLIGVELAKTSEPLNGIFSMFVDINEKLKFTKQIKNPRKVFHHM